MPFRFVSVLFSDSARSHTVGSPADFALWIAGGGLRQYREHPMVRLNAIRLANGVLKAIS
ncbi:hypothetical protein GCM10018966_031640 [Streptomyces yanii]